MQSLPIARFLPWLVERVEGLGRFGWFIIDFAVGTMTHRPPVAEVVHEAYRIGVRSLPILLIVSVFIGTNLTLQGYNAFLPLGGQSMVGLFVALAGVREMAPIMVGAMVAAKAGTEMASQIAVMRMRDQIDALKMMSIHPHWYLVTPRFFGILLVLPALTAISIFTLLVASWMVATLQLGMNGAAFISQAAAANTPVDLLWTTAKSFAFGAVICLLSCYFGFTAESGPRGVGRATNAAVVSSAVLCAFLNYVISELVFG
jgi:phospholipid/cholesterol/gamma-HCH transport system permease protein